MRVLAQTGASTAKIVFSLIFLQSLKISPDHKLASGRHLQTQNLSIACQSNLIMTSLLIQIRVNFCLK